MALGALRNSLRVGAEIDLYRPRLASITPLIAGSQNALLCIVRTSRLSLTSQDTPVTASLAFSATFAATSSKRNNSRYCGAGADLSKSL